MSKYSRKISIRLRSYGEESVLGCGDGVEVDVDVNASHGDELASSESGSLLKSKLTGDLEVLLARLGGGATELGVTVEDGVGHGGTSQKDEVLDSHCLEMSKSQSLRLNYEEKE